MAEGSSFFDGAGFDGAGFDGAGFEGAGLSAETSLAALASFVFFAPLAAAFPVAAGVGRFSGD